MVKKHSSIRLSEEGMQIRKALAKKLGLSESAVVELALRKLAEMEGVKVDEQKKRADNEEPEGLKNTSDLHPQRIVYNSSTNILSVAYDYTD